MDRMLFSTPAQHQLDNLYLPIIRLESRMVLEGATSSTDVPFADSTPASDLDPYAGDGNANYISARSSPSFIPVNPPGTDQVYVNLNNLPQGWNPFTQSSRTQILASGIQDSCRVATSILGRPVRQEEADAFALHFSKSMQIGGWGTPIGIFLGSVQAYRGMADYRFPGFKPRETFNPEKFLFLSGVRARLMWQVVRVNAYWAVGAILGQVFFGSYALSVGLVGRAKDTRLKDFNEALKERQRAGKRIEVPRRVEDTTAGQRQGETFEMARQRKAAQDMRKPRQQQGTWDRRDDDMSPTAGAFAQESLYPGDESNVLSDSQMKQWEGRPQTESRTSATENAAANYGEPSASGARPRASDNTSPSRNTNSSSKQTSSAWERLRQQASSGPTSSQLDSDRSSQARTSSASATDAFEFSRSDAEQQLAKTEAQKDFDARLEREREGRNFDEAQGGRRRR